MPAQGLLRSGSLAVSMPSANEIRSTLLTLIEEVLRAMSITSSVSIGKKPELITLSDAATSKISELIREEEDANQLVLRVAVRAGGCSGFAYEMFFDTEVAQDDEVREIGDFRLAVDPESAEMLKGSSLDYVDGLNGTGFSFSNPNATKTCGCGNSFS